MLLDTDVLIDLEREHPNALAWFESLNELPAVPGFAAMEFLQAAQNATEMRNAQLFLSAFRLVWPTQADLRRALDEFVPLRLTHGLGLLDAVIAATATGSGETLATFNVRHYRAVPGLRIVQPYSR